MNPIKVIIDKELKIAFNSVLVYAVWLASFGVTGFICWLSGSNIFYTGQASLGYLFNVFHEVLYFGVPVLTMKSIASEKKDGTFQLLFSKPIKSWQLIAGKFFAILIEILIMLALTLPYYITIASLGHVDHAVGFCGYLGLICASGCYISMGIFASSLTKNPVIALFATFAITVWFQFLFTGLASLLGNTFIAAILNHLSIAEHFDTLSRGILDSKDIIYFTSIIALFLSLTRYFICKPRT